MIPLLWLLLCVCPVMAVETWSGTAVYEVVERHPEPAGDRRRILEDLQAFLEERLATVEAALRSGDHSRQQAMRLLRIDRAALGEELERVAIALGEDQVVERWTMRLEQAVRGEDPIGPQTRARLETVFRHQVLDHAAGTIVDAASGETIEDVIQRPAPEPLGEATGENYEGHPVRRAASAQVIVRAVADLPNPFACIATEELLRHEDVRRLAAVPGLPLSLHNDLGGGRRRIWRLITWEPESPSP